MPFNIKLSGLELTPAQIQKGPVQKAVQGLMEAIWRDSGGIFAKHLAREVLVETGESVGSLEPLARFTRVILQFKSSPKPRRGFRPSLNPRTGEPEGRHRSFATGVAKGRTAFEFRFTPARYVFEFTIPVFQFFLHESGRVMHPTTMVGALERAADAQQAFALKQFDERVGSLLDKWIATGKIVTVTSNA